MHSPPSALEDSGEEASERTLLVGYSSSRQGDDALALALVLAPLLGLRPTILRVVPVAPYLLGEDPDLAAERGSRLDLEVARERLAALDPGTRAICSHSVSRGLAEVAEEENAALIVVGSTHRGRVGRLIPGTTAAHLLQGGPAAVAIAPPGYSEREFSGVQRIGVGIDGSPESLTALVGAVAFAEATASELHLLAAAEPNPYGYGDALEVLTAGDYKSISTQRARDALEDAIARVPADASVHQHLIHGDPGSRIADETRRLDLLLLGSRGYGPLRRTVLGTVAAFVINNSDCPVVVTPRGVGASAFAPMAHERARAAA